MSENTLKLILATGAEADQPGNRVATLTADGIQETCGLRNIWAAEWQGKEPRILVLGDDPASFLTAQIIAAGTGIYPWVYKGDLPDAKLCAPSHPLPVDPVYQDQVNRGLGVVLHRVADRASNGIVIFGDRTTFNHLNLVFRHAAKGSMAEGRSFAQKEDARSIAAIEYALYADSWENVIDKTGNVCQARVQKTDGRQDAVWAPFQ